MREGLEQILHLVRGDPDATVAYPEMEFQIGRGFFDHFCAYNNLTLFGKLQGIADQIGQHLPQAERITHQGGRQIGLKIKQQL